MLQDSFFSCSFFRCLCPYSVVNCNYDETKYPLSYQQESELTCMHIFGVGANGNVGSSVQLLMNKRYNENKPKMGGRSFERKELPATVNAKVNHARLTIDSNRVSQIRRPFVTVEADVLDIWGDVTDEIDHVSFLPDNRPKMSYVYPLNNEEIKGLIDSGMYHNPRFELLFQSLMESEQFEITKNVELQRLDVLQDDNVVPIILLQDVGLVKQDIDSHETEHYTSFDYALERVIDMALQLEAEGISTSQFVGEDELAEVQEVEIEIDDVFDIESAREEVGDQYDEEIMRQLREMDSEVDVSDAIDHTKLFGQSSEEQRITQLREATQQGTDWDDIDSDDSLFGDDDDIPEDEFGFDAFTTEDLNLVDEIEVEVDFSEPDLVDDEDELEF